MLSLLTEKIPQVVCTILVVLALLVTAPVIAHAHSEIAGQRSAQETRHMMPRCADDSPGGCVSHDVIGICWYFGFVRICF